MTIRDMAREFNTAGPCIEGDHYMLDPLARIDVDEVVRLIDGKRYFVLHAPRQTGKTTCLLALMKRLNEEGRYRAVYANIEAAQAARGDVAAGMRTVVQSIAQKASALQGDDSLLDWVARHREDDPGRLLGGLLLHWARADLTRPAVLLLDEVDALVGNTRGISGQSETFYENVKRLNQIENELQGRAKNREDVEVYRRGEPLVDMVAEGNKAEAAVSRLRRMRREVQLRQEVGYQERVREIDRKIVEVMVRLNRGVVGTLRSVELR
jgi:hypothetical protein